MTLEEWRTWKIWLWRCVALTSLERRKTERSEWISWKGEWGDQIVGVFQKKGSSGCSSNSVQVADNEPDQHDATIDDQCRR